MKEYIPRRSGKRWREGAPAYILDVFDNRGQSIDRYTVMFCGEQMISDGTREGTYIPYLAMSNDPSSPQGFSQCGELRSWEAADYRYREKRFRIRWLDLPAHIREHVEARVAEAE